MRFLLQRVSRGEVKVDGQSVGAISAGLLALVGIGQGDSRQVADRMIEKTLGLRIFADEHGKMNRDIMEAGGELLLVSQFTLYADCRKGRRPSFAPAASPAAAKDLFEYCCWRAAQSGVPTRSGRFATEMQVSLVNNGPVTIWLDSEKLRF